MTRGRTRLAGKNLLFAELIIVILFFSLAAAGCVTLFADAYSDAQHSRDLTNAIIRAQNVAEVFKASDGSFASWAALQIETDKNMEYNDGLEVLLEREELDGIMTAVITVYKGEVFEGEILYSLTVGVIQ